MRARTPQAAKCLFDVALGNGESAGVPLPDILLVCLFQVTLLLHGPP
jgi:hypothetical protein